MSHYKNKMLKKVLVNAAYSRSEREFGVYYERLRRANITISNWLDEIPRDQWCQYADAGRRYDHMTTNI
ncbi:hypothetical protein PIB30_090032, partial [Stylosanthes scabra]|nr:hypothetical protein [Stylosanthes scabra]